MKYNLLLPDVKYIFEQMIAVTKDKETLSVLLPLYNILKAKIKDVSKKSKNKD